MTQTKLTGVELIALERKRQIEELGYDTHHDSFEENQELAVAAGLYALHGTYAQEILDEYIVAATDGNGGGELWPWGDSEGPDKRETLEHKRRLVIAGALIAAEIDRLQVKELKENAG